MQANLGQQQQQQQVTGYSFAGSDGVNQFQNGSTQLGLQSQMQLQPVASTSALPNAFMTWPVASAPPSEPTVPLVPAPAPANASAPAPTVVDLTADSDDSPKVPARGLSGMDVDPTPFDDLGSSPNPSSPRPINVIKAVSTRLEAPRVPANFNPARPSLASNADSSSFAQAPAPRPLKRPAPHAAAPKHKFSGPMIPNNPELGDLAPLLTPGALRQEKPALLFRKLRKRGEDSELPPQFQPTPRQLILILDALQKGVSNTYLMLMADNELYTEVVVGWIKTMAKDVEMYEPGITTLFNLLARTNMPVNFIEDFRVKTWTERLRSKAEEKGKYLIRVIP